MKTERVRLPRKLNKSVSGGKLTEAGRLRPVGALGITLNMLPLHRVTMNLSEDDLPLAIHDLVEVYNQNGSVGVYRVSNITSAYGKERQVSLAHGLDVLADSSFACIEKYAGTVAGFMQRIIDAQTQAIGGVKYWRLGTCADTRPWNKDIKYNNLLECLMEIVRTEEDYMLTFDQSAFPWTMNFVARDGDVLSEFRLSRNTESCRMTLDDQSLCTRLFLSVTTETQETVVSGDTTYIAGTKTSEGYYTYDDTAAQAVWGIVEKSAGVKRKDVPTEPMLAAWVDAYFSRHNAPAVQITVSGEELNRLTGESIDEMHIGRICRVALPDYATVFTERIVSVNYPDALRAPYRVKVDLANKRQTSEGAFSEIRHTAGSAGTTAATATVTAANTETAQNKANIIYNLKVESDNKHFAVIGSEEWFDDMWGTQSTLIGKYTSDFEVTARKLTSAFSVTGVAVGEDGMPIVDEHGNYTFNGSGNTLSSQITQTAGRIDLVVEGSGQSASIRIGKIVEGINEQAVQINANRIYLNGQVIANSISATDLRVTNLTTGITRATAINSDAFSGDVIYANTQLSIGSGTGGGSGTLYYRGAQYYRQGLTLGPLNSLIAEGHFLGDSSTTLSLNHSHSVTMTEITTGANAGKVQATIGSAVPENDASATDYFDIAGSTTYTNGVLSARNAVKVNPFTADPRTTLNDHRKFTYITDAPTPEQGTSQEDTWFLAGGTIWSNNKTTVGLHYGTASGTKYAQLEVDASSIVSAAATAAGYAGRAAVTLLDPAWNPISGQLPSTRTVTVATSGRTDSGGVTDNLSKSVALYLTQGSWNTTTNTLIVSMRSGSIGGTAWARTEVDASSVFDRGENYGYGEGFTEGYSAGYDAGYDEASGTPTVEVGSVGSGTRDPSEAFPMYTYTSLGAVNATDTWCWFAVTVNGQTSRYKFRIYR